MHKSPPFIAYSNANKVLSCHYFSTPISTIMTNTRSYDYYRQAFAQQTKPFAYVDLDFFDANVAAVAQRAGDKRIRMASKSIRCTALLRRVLEHSDQYQGIMCFTASEAVWLSEQGFDDLLVAYPTLEPAVLKSVAEAIKKGRRIYLMTDKKEHLAAIDAAGRAAEVVMPICLDLDVSSRYPGLHFGVHRSSVIDLETVKEYAQQLTQFAHLQLHGLMGYEAQIAGVGDQTKGQGLKNKIIQRLQRHSIPQVRKKRAQAVAYLEQALGQPLTFVNGGGTGSLESTREEKVVTEVTAGSAFFAPTLFDHYSKFQHLPAVGFAIEIVRQPQPNIYTCLGRRLCRLRHGGQGQSTDPVFAERLPTQPQRNGRRSTNAHSLQRQRCPTVGRSYLYAPQQSGRTL